MTPLEKENKETHDLAMSAMVPTYCRKCNKSGYELSKSPCKFSIHPQPEGIDEVTERIVIEYANLSGRESANRSIFREITREHIEDFVREEIERAERKAVMKWQEESKELIHDRSFEAGKVEGAALERRRLEEATSLMKKRPTHRKDGMVVAPVGRHVCQDDECGLDVDEIGFNEAVDAFISLLRTSN